MKINTVLGVVLCLITTVVSAQNKQAYQLFDKKGKKISYEKMLKSISGSDADVLLFGEFHDNPIAHWLQFELTTDLMKSKQLILGAEMFEADNQQVLNDYLTGRIDQKGLDTLARLWNNYKTDYKPLVDLAKKNKLSFIATNIPRKFASLVYKNGFSVLDTLSDTEKKWIAPLPIVYDATLPGYVRMLKMMNGHGGENLPKAQAVKDATMGYFILKNIQKNTLFIHYNGSFHSDYFDGINWYLKRGNSEIKIKTIATVSQKEVSVLEKDNKEKADYIIVVNENMTKTF